MNSVWNRNSLRLRSRWMLCLCLQVGDEESREQLIKTHYMARVGELTTQLQISDSKAVHFHSEVKPLQPRLYLNNCLIEQKTDPFTAQSFSTVACHLQRRMGNFNAVTCSVPLCVPLSNHSIITIFVCFCNLRTKCRN